MCSRALGFGSAARELMQHRRTYFARLLALSCLLSLWACGESSSSPTDAGTDVAGGGDAPITEGGVNWSTHISPLLIEHCNSCHTEGGSAPFALDTHEETREFSASILDAIVTGRMPPWQADPECRDLEGARVMPEADIATFRGWINEGMPPGPDTDVEPPSPLVFEATHTARMQESYTPDVSQADDYRCFILDLDFDTDMYLTGSTVVPGNGLVHHVLVFGLDQAAAETAAELDAAEDGPGYTCFGGPLPIAVARAGGGIGAIGAAIADLALPSQIGAWVPGQVPRMQRDGTAMRIAAGDAIVMQVHYSAVAGDPIPDSATEFQAILTTDEPERLARMTPLVEQDLDIPAGEASTTAIRTITYYNDAPLEVHGITPHMHLLGTHITAEVVRADGREECGVDIPDWDFQWQESYVFAEGSEILLEPGDSIRLTCEYDNSAANQPVVNGVQLEPRDVAWGDGTLDEMCLLYVFSVSDFTQARAATSAACSAPCVEQCGTDLECLGSCEGPDVNCFGCVLSEGFDCGVTECIGLLAQAQTCLGPCVRSSVMLLSNFGTCMEETCADAYAPAAACVGEVMARDGCADAREACGL